MTTQTVVVVHDRKTDAFLLFFSFLLFWDLLEPKGAKTRGSVSEKEDLDKKDKESLARL